MDRRRNDFRADAARDRGCVGARSCPRSPTALAAGLPGAARSCCRPSRRSSLSARALDPATIEARFDVADGYYLYRDKIHFTIDPVGAACPPSLPRGQRKHDEFFGDVETYRGPVVIRVPLPSAAPGRTLTAPRRFAGLRRRRRLLSAQSAALEVDRAGRGRQARRVRRGRQQEKLVQVTGADRRVSAGDGAAPLANRGDPRALATSHRRFVIAAALRRRRCRACRRRRAFRESGTRAARRRRRCSRSVLPDRRRTGARRSPNGAARCWSSTSGRRGARPAARRCRSSSPSKHAMAAKGVQFVGIAVDQADKVREFVKEIG